MPDVTVGIIGFGAIGRLVARVSLPLDAPPPEDGCALTGRAQLDLMIRGRCSRTRLVPHPSTSARQAKQYLLSILNPGT